MGKFLFGVLTGIAMITTVALVSDKVGTYLYCKRNPLPEEGDSVSEETGETDE